MLMIEAPHLSNRGVEVDVPPTERLTIVHHLREAVANGGDRPAFRFRLDRDGGYRTESSQWSTISWNEYGDHVEQLAAAFLLWGIQAGDRVAILAENCWQWHVSDMAILTIGAVSVPIYPTSSPSQIRYILKHSTASLCIVGNAEQHAKLLATSDTLETLPPTLHRLVRIHTSEHDHPTVAQRNSISVVTWDQARDVGGTKVEGRAAAVSKRFREVKSSDLATIVYTSGTTGPPKGVMLTHGNITATVSLVRNIVPLGPADRFISFLPLSHIAERVISNFGQVASGGETWFAKSFSTVSKDIVDCKPTVFFAVPRVWEKVRESFEVKTHELDPLRKQLVQRYQRSMAPDRQSPQRSFLRRFESNLLDRTIGRSIRIQMGLDKATALYSGAAPIDPELLRWLRTIGLNIGEVYGQTEVCGPTSVAAPNAIRIGTVGRPLPGMEVRIDQTDGEILVRGPNVCAGYFCNDEATRLLFDDDGWMFTGDLGTLDEDGYLRITGRKKDLMKTALGKYVAPQELEMRLRSGRFIGNAVVVAEGRPYISALLTLDAESVGPWAHHRDKPLSIEALAVDPDVLTEVTRQVDEVNQQMSPPERVRNWRLLSRDFTVDEGELTPTLKVIRTAVMNHFANDISAMYATKETDADTPTQCD
jgi:long-chain acyl-CoA synthetase